MKNYYFPYCTILLSATILIVSFYAAYEITGSLFSRVRITDLEKYGVRIEYLIEGELWRLFTSQIVHVKQLHMIFNVVSFFLLGICLERYIGSSRFFLLWFVSGAVGAVFSTLFGKPP